MPEIKIIYDQYSEITNYRNPDNEWDKDDSYHDYNIKGVAKNSKHVYGEIVSVPFELDPSRVYHVLYVIYSTGDSFSRKENGAIEFIGVYEDLEQAQENKKRIKEHHKIYEDLKEWGLSPKERKKLKKKNKGFEEYSVMLVENGQEYKLHVPWHGYFERLSEIEIKPVLVLDE